MHTATDMCIDSYKEGKKLTNIILEIFWIFPSASPHHTTPRHTHTHITSPYATRLFDFVVFIFIFFSNSTSRQRERLCVYRMHVYRTVRAYRVCVGCTQGNVYCLHAAILSNLTIHSPE